MKTRIAVPAKTRPAIARPEQNQISHGSRFAQAAFTGPMPGVEQNGEAFAVDWQLPDPLAVEDGRPVQNGRERIVALGTPVDDIHLQAEHVEITGDTLHFNTGGRRLAVRCAGKPSRWGEKGHAATDLVPFAAVPGARVVSGGGLLAQPSNSRNKTSRDRRIVAIHPTED